MSSFDAYHYQYTKHKLQGRSRKMKVLLMSLVFIICFSPVNIFGQCIEGNCVNGKGTFVSPDGAKYIGQFKDSR